MHSSRQTLLFLGDVAALVASFFIMVAIRFDWNTQGDYIAQNARLFGYLFIIWLIVFYVFDLYNFRRVNPNPRNIGFLILALLCNIGLTSLALYLFPVHGLSPKTNLAIVGISSFALLVLWRRLFYKLFTSTFIRKIGIIGKGPLIDHLIEELRAHPYLGTIVSIEHDHVNTMKSPMVDMYIVDGIDLAPLVSFIQNSNSEVLSLSQAYEALFGKIPLELMTEEKGVELITHQQLHGARWLFTRLMEILIALLVLVVASPFLIITVIAIALESKGPILYKQIRIGQKRKAFALYKFRSMYALMPDGSAEKTGAQWAEKNDPRVTKVGRIIRKLHIDEVPQMFNILLGDLALVGPRPERPDIVAMLEREIPFYSLRHIAKPGFTGWAQIKYRYARSVDDTREKFEYDLYYLLNKNPFFDLGIFAKTVQIIFTH